MGSPCLAGSEDWLTVGMHYETGREDRVKYFNQNNTTK